MLAEANGSCLLVELVRSEELQAVRPRDGLWGQPVGARQEPKHLVVHVSSLEDV